MEKWENVIWNGDDVTTKEVEDESMRGLEGAIRVNRAQRSTWEDGSTVGSVRYSLLKLQ